MFGLRSARGRAILASVVLLALLASFAGVAIQRARELEQQHDSLKQTSAVATALEQARAQLFEEQVALAGLALSGDPALVDAHHEAVAALEQDLSQARVGMLAEGDADEVLALENLTERIGGFNEEIANAIPTVLGADPETRLRLASVAMAELSSEVETFTAELDRLAENEQNELAARTAAADRAVETTLWLFIGLGAAGFVVATGVVAMLVVWVVRPLASLQAKAREITASGLRVRADVSGPEEIASLARDFNEMTDALSAKTEEYIATANLTGDVIVRLDKDGMFTFLNDGACEFFGRPREELLGTDASAFMHPEDLERAAQAVREVIESKGLVRGFESRLVTPMGTRVVEWNGYPLFDDEDQYAGIQITGRDTTERRHMEEALRAKTQEYIATANLTEDIIGRADKEGRWVFLNDAACQFFGKSREELLETDARASLHPEDLEPTVQAVREAAATREPINGFVNRQLTPMGTRVVEWNASPLFDGEGQYTGIQMTGRDITERKQMEEELRESEEKYRRVVEDSIDGIGIVEGLEVRFVNQAILKMFGCESEEEMLGRPFTDFLPLEEQQPLVDRTRARQAGEREPSEYELRALRKDGTPFHAEVSVVTITYQGRPAVQAIVRDITERKQMEEALASSEEKYRRVIEDSIDGIVIVEGLEVRFVNRAVVEMFGYQTEEEILGQPFTDFVSPEYRQLMLDRAHRREAGEDVPSRYEFKGLRKDGSEFSAELSIGRIVYQGRVALQGIVRDITQRKQMEEALQESESRYRLLAENATDVIWTMDLGLRYTYVSPSITRMRGYSVEEVMAQTVNESMTPASREVAMKTLAEELAIEKMAQKDLFRSRTLELEMNCKDGSTIWCEMKMTFLRDRDGQPVGIQGVTRDISERKKAEEGLQSSEERFKTVFEFAPDGYYLLDLQGKFVDGNRAAEKIIGYRRDQVIGKNLAEAGLLCREEVAKAAIHLLRCAQGLPAGPIEYDLIRKDGKRVPVEIRTFPVKIEDQTLVLGIARDISERKKAEEERERLHAQLQLRAITDSLTDLYDHAHFYRRLGEEIERSKRYNNGFAVVMMDVDDFKRFNDSRGHQAGDEMLRFVADCIRSGLRRSDLAFRYGGDEFAAILPHADSSKARAAVNRINKHLTSNLKQTDGEAAGRLSLSAGVACFPEEGTTADDLVRIADAALYSAKWIARARDIMGQREDIQSLVSTLVSRRAGVEAPADGAIFRPEALHEQHARIVSSVASSIAVALKDAGVSQALEDPDLQILALVGAAAEIKDRYIRGHPERTSQRAVALAEVIGLSPEQVRDIQIAGLLHDIGKVTVSEGILNKSGKLTRREFATIKEHPIVGATLVSQARGFERLVPIIGHHHERFDGKGYPDGLAGEEIPLEARILSVVDVFDALTHERSYRKALSREEAIAELERGAGTQFDPTVVKAFLASVKRQGEEPAAPAQAASEDRQLAGARVPGRGKR